MFISTVLFCENNYFSCWLFVIDVAWYFYVYVCMLSYIV
ncbi:putative membrane protein [Escherichia coli STEC_MHI813]|nr:putative membrane protein [Escherichia coli STEC_MHI813]